MVNLPNIPNALKNWKSGTKGTHPYRGVPFVPSKCWTITSAKKLIEQ